MADKIPLGEAIRAAVPPVVKRTPAWWERLDADTLAEVEAIRRDFHAGALGGSRSAVARAIASELTARGLVEIGWQGVTAWLARD
jgi:hypothetical protein